MSAAFRVGRVTRRPGVLAGKLAVRLWHYAWQELVGGSQLQRSFCLASAGISSNFLAYRYSRRSPLASFVSAGRVPKDYRHNLHIFNSLRMYGRSRAAPARKTVLHWNTAAFTIEKAGCVHRKSLSLESRILRRGAAGFLFYGVVAISFQVAV